MLKFFSSELREIVHYLIAGHDFLPGSFFGTSRANPEGKDKKFVGGLPRV